MGLQNPYTRVRFPLGPSKILITGTKLPCGGSIPPCAPAGHYNDTTHAQVAEPVYAADLKSVAERPVGSTPTLGIIAGAYIF